MTTLNPVATYALRLGDNGLILAQRLGAWCGHAPELEIDLALAVGREAELRAEKHDFLLGRLAEWRGEGQEVGHPTAVDVDVGRRERGAAGLGQRRLVVDEHVEMRGDGVEARHRAGGFVECVEEDAQAAFF